MEFRVKRVKEELILINLFYFFSKTFFYEDKEHNQRYEYMYERYNEMKRQFEVDKDLLFYMEDKNEIIAGLTIKNRNEKDEATIGMLAVSRNYRNKGIAEMLMRTAEDECSKKGIKFLSLGARVNALNFYKKMGYNPMLMVQIYDFETIENVKNVNDRYKNYPIINEYKDVAYGFVFFEIENLLIKDINHFENNLDVCNVQYVFTKEL